MVLRGKIVTTSTSTSISTINKGVVKHEWPQGGGEVVLQVVAIGISTRSISTADISTPNISTPKMSSGNISEHFEIIG